MSAADEGRINFDDLPLRALKQFIEDTVELNPQVANIQSPGAGTGATVTPSIPEAAESAMPYPNHLGGAALVVPTWYSAQGGNPSGTGNLGSPGREQWYCNRWIAPRDMDVDRASTIINCANGLNANSKLAVGLWDSLGTTRLTKCVFKHVNSDLGAGGGVNVLVTFSLEDVVGLVAGTTYVFGMGLKAGASNGINQWLQNQSHAVISDLIIVANGGNVATDADEIRYRLDFLVEYTADPGGAPASLAASVNGATSADARNFWLWKS